MVLEGKNNLPAFEFREVDQLNKLGNDSNVVTLFLRLLFAIVNAKDEKEIAFYLLGDFMASVFTVVKYVPTLLRVVPKVLNFLHRMTDGKKTVTGAISLVLWLAIYGGPVFFPDSGIAEGAQQLADFLKSIGLNLDYDLLVGGGTLERPVVFSRRVSLFLRCGTTILHP